MLDQWKKKPSCNLGLILPYLCSIFHSWEKLICLFPSNPSISFIDKYFLELQHIWYSTSMNSWKEIWHCKRFFTYYLQTFRGNPHCLWCHYALTSCFFCWCPIVFMSANKLQWTNMITLKNDCMSFFPKKHFSHKSILEPFFEK